MVNLPVKGDTVDFVLNGHIVMKGVVNMDGFVSGNEHQTHFANMGSIRPHAEVKEYTWITITNIGLHIPVRWTGQSTWARNPW